MELSLNLKCEEIVITYDAFGGYPDRDICRIHEILDHLSEFFEIYRPSAVLK